MKVKTIFLRTEHNYDTNEASDAGALECKDETRTQQHFKEEVDINTIVERFGLGGKMPDNLPAPSYGDYTNVVDFKTAMDAVAKAGESFDRLPAAVRAKFMNDPQELLDFVENEANRPEAERLGLIMPKPQPPTPSPDPVKGEKVEPEKPENGTT